MRRDPLPGGSGLRTPADRVGPFEHTYAPCARSDLSSCSSADDGLARPSEAADAAGRSERACRCYRRTGSYTLDGGGHQGVGCSCVAASVQGRASCASVTTASTLRALCSIGCFAWPCQPIVGRAAGTEVRSRTRGVRVFKGTDAVGRRMKAAATRQRLARREQIACIDGRCRHIRSMRMHRIILHAIRPVLSPRSEAGTRPGPHPRFPGPEVKRKDALRRPTDARDGEGDGIRGRRDSHPVQQTAGILTSRHLSFRPKKKVGLKAERSPDATQPLGAPRSAMRASLRGVKNELTRVHAKQDLDGERLFRARISRIFFSNLG